MSTVIVSLVLAVAAVLQAVVLPELSASTIFPDFTLVIVLIWSAVRGTQEGLIWAFGAGILLDTLALDPLGGNALALLPAVLLGGMTAQRFFNSVLIVPVLAVIVATFFHTVLLLLIRSSGGSGLELSAVGRLFVNQAFLNIILVPPTYLFASMAQKPPAMRHV